ncbi:MAG: twin-arginine translocase TatA/TatE family subunit [Candidatus Cryptobacteroides sp.]|nr:twin-arginine translocase TatA/TatE family subunit [Bacteroidales bacterium]
MLSYPLMIGWWEIVLIALIVLLFFGGKKVPELMKGLGKGVRSFKEGLNEVDKSIEQKSDSDSEKKSE